MDDEETEETDGADVLDGTENAVTEALCKPDAVLEEGDESCVDTSRFNRDDFVVFATQGLLVLLGAGGFPAARCCTIGLTIGNSEFKATVLVASLVLLPVDINFIQLSVSVK